MRMQCSTCNKVHAFLAQVRKYHNGSQPQHLRGIISMFDFLRFTYILMLYVASKLKLYD